MMRVFQAIGCVMPDGYVVRYFAAVSLPAKDLSQATADEFGFVFDDTTESWVRELTPTIAAYETKNLAPTKVVVFPTRLKVVDGVSDVSPDFPVDTTFKKAWVYDGKTVQVDMPKARELQRSRIRALRKLMFTDLDSAFTRAQGRAAMLDGSRKSEAEATMRAVEAQRQALRDAPADPAIDAAKTPEELLATTPGVLKD